MKNECEQNERMDKVIRGEGEQLGLLSAAGSLPCPMFPQMCECGHVPLFQV